MPAKEPAFIARRLPPVLRAYLLRRAWCDRGLFVGRLIGGGLAAAIAWSLAAALIDRMWGLGPHARRCLMGADCIFLVLMFAGTLRELFRPIDFLRTASAMEPAFGQRLETLVSQWLRPNDPAKPDLFIGELLKSVEGELPRHSPAAAVPWKRLIAPWSAALIAAGAAGILWLIPGIGLRQLSARLLSPSAPIPAVTTTRLEVIPGDASVVEEMPMNVRVVAERLGQVPPVIHFSSDAMAFAKTVMSAGDGAFFWNVPAAQKDFVYYVTGGDATSPRYHVTVLHPPALSELRVRYNYPAYTHRDPLRVNTQTGPIEGPQGTRVGVDVVSVTPLASATLQMGDHSFTASRGSSGNICHFDLTLDHDAQAELRLVGANGVPAKQETALKLVALPDQPPLAQLLQPSTDIHLTPRDLLTIAWQALDDFGVDNIFLQWQINNEPPRQIPLPASGDPRRCGGVVDVDLADMPLKIGDILSISIIVRDGVGHETRTPQRQISISPRAVDIDSYLRLAYLRQATDLSATLASDLQAAVAAWSSANHLNQNLSAAADASSLLRQALVQAVQHASDAPTVTATGDVADRVAAISAAIEQTQLNARHEDRLSAAADSAHQLQASLNIITQGQQAAMVLADRANVREISATKQTDPQLRLRLEQTLARASEEAAQGVSDLGISDKSAHIDEELNQRVRAGEQAAEAMKPVDLLSAAAQWATDMRRPADAPRDLARRLEMASDIESVRVGGEPVRARDLRLAGRAANRIEETALHDPIVSREVLAKMIGDYPRDLTAMLQGGGTAAAARAQMKLWAAEPDLFSSATDVLDQPAAQDLAMEANARMAERDYAGAAALDARLADLPEARQARQNIVAAARQMRTAERVDQVSAQQQSLAAQTLTPTHSDALARDQEQVAQNIEQVRRQSGDAEPIPHNSRDQAMAAIVHAQQQLAGMPGQLTGPGQQAQVQSASSLANDLDRFKPETSPVVAAIRDNLIPSLQQLNPSKPDQLQTLPAKTARASIAKVQTLLAEAQQKFADQDPFVAAKWAAEAAASALLRQPPDLPAAHQQQNNVARALENAYTALIRQAALERLAGSATISPPLSATAPPAWPAGGTAAPVSAGDSEPAGYAAALRAYFQKLSENHDGP